MLIVRGGFAMALMALDDVSPAFAVIGLSASGIGRITLSSRCNQSINEPIKINQSINQLIN